MSTLIKSAWPIESLTLRAYCKCGAAIHLTTKPSNISFVMETFANAHIGNGHEPCDAKTAAKARRKKVTI